MAVDVDRLRRQTGHTCSLGRASAVNWPEIIFIAFLVLVFVGLRPFAVRDLAQLQRLSSGEGDLLRQVSYSGVFLLTVTAVMLKSGRAAFRAIPLSMALVVAWTFASIFWSIAPELTLRRSALNFLIALTVLLNVHLLGAERVLRTLIVVLGAILIVNLLSLLWVPQAMHSLHEADATLAGNWRGLYFHKNIAGPTTALSALLFLYMAISRRRVAYWALFAGAVLFTIGSGSKTATALLPLSIVGMLAFWWTNGLRHRRDMLAVSLGVLTVLVLAAIVIAGDQIAELLSDRNSFTGRGAIWQLVASYLVQHPVAGSGFGAFWQSGTVSPALALARENWLLTVAHSHNGYLEVVVATGFVGLALCLLAFALLPLRRLFVSEVAHGPLIFSVLIFCLALNLTETALLEGDRPEWVMMLLVIALGGTPRTQHLRPDEGRSR